MTVPDVVTAPGSVPRPGRRRVWVQVAPAVVLAGVGCYVAIQVAGGFADAFRALGDVDVRWLAAALGCEALSYVLLSAQLRYLAGHRADLPPDAALRVGLVVYGLGIITPASPAEGMVLASAELRRRGVTKRRAALALGFSEWYSTGALYLLAAVNVAIAALVGDIPAEQRGPFLIIAAVVVTALITTAVLLRHRSVVERVAVWLGALRPARSRQSINHRRATGARWHAEARTMVGTRRDHTIVFGLALGAWIADALCLFFTLTAAGPVVDADVLLLAYTAGILATEVPLLPAGLGLVETAMPAVLRSSASPTRPPSQGRWPTGPSAPSCPRSPVRSPSPACASSDTETHTAPTPPTTPLDKSGNARRANRDHRQRSARRAIRSCHGRASWRTLLCFSPPTVRRQPSWSRWGRVRGSSLPPNAGPPSSALGSACERPRGGPWDGHLRASKERCDGIREPGFVATLDEGAMAFRADYTRAGKSVAQVAEIVRAAHEGPTPGPRGSDRAVGTSGVCADRLTYAFAVRDGAIRWVEGLAPTSLTAAPRRFRMPAAHAWERPEHDLIGP